MKRHNRQLKKRFTLPNKDAVKEKKRGGSRLGVGWVWGTPREKFLGTFLGKKDAGRFPTADQGKRWQAKEQCYQLKGTKDSEKGQLGEKNPGGGAWGGEGEKTKKIRKTSCITTSKRIEKEGKNKNKQK